LGNIIKKSKMKIIIKKFPFKLSFEILLIIIVLFNSIIAQKKIVIGPNYNIDALLTDLGNPKGKKFELIMPLTESKIFRGDDSTLDPEKSVNKFRKLFVYMPAAYKDGTVAPVLITMDGPSHFDLICNALDNLTISNQEQRKLPAFILVSVQNGGGNAKGSQRGLEYDTMSDCLALFINNEVLPAVEDYYEIKELYPGFKISKNPWDRAVMGCSSGGAAAFTMGWFRPDLFRRIISYSGTFVDQQDDDAPEEEMYPLGAWEYHSGMKLIENSEKKQLRVFLHVSENDLQAKGTLHHFCHGHPSQRLCKSGPAHSRNTFGNRKETGGSDVPTSNTNRPGPDQPTPKIPND